MTSPKVLISGSGIAGSVFASWLLRAYPNADITIVERDPALRLTGASVDIRSSAVDIIKWMGAEEQIRAQATKEAGVQIVDAKGAAVATFRATGNTKMQSFTSEFEIFRGELANIFIKPILSKIKLIFDETVDHYEQLDDEKVAVTFKNSKKTEVYDFLVAADGLGSKIRGQMLNSSPQEQFLDNGTHIAYFTIKGDLLQGDRLAKAVNATCGRSVFLRPDPNPIGLTRCNLLKVTSRQDVETRAKIDKALREGNASYMALMQEMFHDVGWVTPEVLKGMHESEDFYCSQFGQIRSPKLHDGSVVLLGDAGYATPGIGTSLAIIGGYVLAGELLNNPGDIRTALKQYSDIMVPFVKHSQRGGADMSLMMPYTQWGITLRNLVLRFVTWMRLDKLTMMLASALGYTEKKVNMPDYPWPVQ